MHLNDLFLSFYTIFQSLIGIHAVCLLLSVTPTSCILAFVGIYLLICCLKTPKIYSEISQKNHTIWFDHKIAKKNKARDIKDCFSNFVWAVLVKKNMAADRPNSMPQITAPISTSNNSRSLQTFLFEEEGKLLNFFMKNYSDLYLGNLYFGVRDTAAILTGLSESRAGARGWRVRCPTHGWHTAECRTQLCCYRDVIFTIFPSFWCLRNKTRCFLCRMKVITS